MLGGSDARCTDYTGGGASGIGSRTRKVTAASSAPPWSAATFTIVEHVTASVKGAANGTRTGTPATVAGLIPEMIIDAENPISWPPASVVAIFRAGV